MPGRIAGVVVATLTAGTFLAVPAAPASAAPSSAGKKPAAVPNAPGNRLLIPDLPELTDQTGAGRSTTSSPLRDAVEDVVEAGAIGSSVRVRTGKRVTAGAAGLADRDTGRRLRADDQFEIGSNTKTMMATIALQLVGEGKLGLDDSLEELLPGFVPGGKNITLRMLLRHTSGLYNYTSDPELIEGFFADPTAYYSPEELAAEAVKRPPVFEPDARWEYSNTNYLLVGLILERATGRTPADLLQERIARPLGLRHTYLPTNAASNTGRGYAHGYTATVTGPSSRPEIEYTDVSDWSLSWAWTAGAVISTTPDLSLFISALLSGRLLRPAQLAAMLATVPMDPERAGGYGLGILRVDTPCGPVWGHTGGTLGHSSLMFASPNGHRTLGADTTTVFNDEGEPSAPTKALREAENKLLLTAVCRLYDKDVPQGTNDSRS
ncbi:MAG: serine hydrolase [Actinomycetota bacterium]|nr:serine hydrolase [Actinomycetota bacterium]